MGLSNRGPRGIATKMVAGRFDYLRIPKVDPLGAWTSQSFLADGTFSAPSGGVQRNGRGKIDVFLVGCAAGGAGGDLGVSDPCMSGSGGQAGDFVFFYKVALFPGERVPVTIGAGGTIGNNGGSTIFGAYLTLSGGIKGIAAISSSNSFTPTNNPTNGGTIISGSVLLESAVYEGCFGGWGGYVYEVSNPYQYGLPNAGQSCVFLGAYVGGLSGIAREALVDSTTGILNDITPVFRSGGGGGAGLFGSGADGKATGVVASATANTGAGAGGGNTTRTGASGRLDVYWRIAA